MKIDNAHVYDLYESIIASGLPMETDFCSEDFLWEVEYLKKNSNMPEMERALRLAANPPGTGHNNFLSGILVSANITATNAWWLQFGRYHFAQIVSSQSKMHRIKKLALNPHAFAEGTNAEAVSAFCKLAENCDDTETLVDNCPMGLLLTARITTNYLQLKTIYQQRKNHKLREWRDFCTWIESLPMSEMICGAKENVEKDKPLDPKNCTSEHFDSADKSWIKEGAYAYLAREDNPEGNYMQITQPDTDNSWVCAKYLTGTKRECCCHLTELLQAKLRPWTFEEAPKTIKVYRAGDIVSHPILLRLNMNYFPVFLFDEDKSTKMRPNEVLERYKKIDGSPCGTFEHKNEKGEWVK